MSAVGSRKSSPPPPSRLPDQEVRPLKTLDELLAYKKQLLCALEPLNEAVKRGAPNDPKVLFCHEAKGGYHADRFIHGCDDTDAYRFHEWQKINTFVYYTYNLVTIPPPGWISAAHRHGVRVLGTFMLDSAKGQNIIETIRNSGLLQQVAKKLAQVASLWRFDGWLVSIRCRVDAGCVPFIKDLLKAIKMETHSTVPGSLVIWYDGVDARGKMIPHNELNKKNVGFFELCDGIFLHLRWAKKELRRSAQLAGDRRADVYAGVDMFKANMFYASGYGLSETVEMIRTYGLSTAIFGAGRVYDRSLTKNFLKNQYRLWDFPDKICPEWRLTALPLCTSFCQGVGKKLFSAGAKLSNKPWFNLSKQQLQPRDQGNTLCNTCGSATVHMDDAYDGGSCIRLLFKAKEQHADEEPYFRLFGCDFPLGSLTVSYAFKVFRDTQLAGPDVALVLKVKTPSGETEDFFLGVTVSQLDDNNYLIRRECQAIPDAALSDQTDTWCTRDYYVEDKRGGSTLIEIGLRLFPAGADKISCLLGHIEVRRPEEEQTGTYDAYSDEEDSWEEEQEWKRPRIA